MKRIRRPFISVAIIFLIIGLMPNWRRVKTTNVAGASTETRDECTLGVPPSPLMMVKRSHREQVRGTETTTGDQTSFKLEFVSWSMLSVALGALFLLADRLWHRNRK
jgi:hypothetical protein